MGQSLSTLIKNNIFGEDIYLENNNCFKNCFTEKYELESFYDYDNIEIENFVNKTDIIVLEVNEEAIGRMSWGFIEYLMENIQ